MGRTADNTTAPDHGRTPENTPLPGGGRWEWDALAGAWRSLDEPADGSAATPAQE